MSDTIHFRRAHNITPPTKDGYVYAFPFCVVPEDNNASDTTFFTSDFRVIVAISSLKVKDWKLRPEEIEPILLQAAKEEAMRRLANKTLSKRMEIDVATSHPDGMPESWQKQLVPESE